MRVSTVLLMLSCVVVAGLMVAYAQPPAGQGTAPATADLPGITTQDKFPNGCVSCHIKLPDGEDVRINALLKGVEGHPTVAGLKNVPTDCKACHKPDGKAPGLNTLLHKVHFGKKAESKYVAMFQGACLNCHKLNTETGKMTVKSGPKNW